MKFNQLILIIIITMINAFNAILQSNYPLSYYHQNDIKAIDNSDTNETYVGSVPNVDSVLHILDSVSNAKNIFLYGEEKYTYIPRNQKGLIDIIDNQIIWRYKIICPLAKSINILFSNIFIYDTAKIFIYTPDYLYIKYPLTSYINESGKYHTTGRIPNDTVVVELNANLSDIDSTTFNIYGVVHGYQDISSNPSNPDGCDLNANCPQGDYFCREKYSVGIYEQRYTISPEDTVYWGLSTGFLINNTKEDYTPYFMTAWHVIDINSNGILDNKELESLSISVIEFGYMKEFCSGGDNLPSYDYSGVSFISGWCVTDFALLLLDEKPKSGEENFPDVYFSGWDRSNKNAGDYAAVLHHPGGKITFTRIWPTPMKIAESYFFVKEECNLNNFYFSCPNNTGELNSYHVTFSDGAVSRGSSGAPLYDINNKAIGICSGVCYPPEDTDPCDIPYANFGTFSLSWLGGGTDDTSLHTWLDPDGTNVETLDGIHLPNNQYGHIFDLGSFNRFAYDHLRVGSGIHSGVTSPFRVESGVSLTMKAGREIRIRPCSQFVSGSEVHAYIEDPDCDDVIKLSDKDNIYTTGCGAYPILAPQDSHHPISTETINFQDDTELINYPNPASGHLNIEYTISQPTSAKIILKDIFGSKLREFVNNSNHPMGNFKLDFDISNLSQGAYFLTLITPEKTITKQIVVTR